KLIWREKDEPYDDERRNRTRNSDRRTRSKNRSRWRRNRPAITVSRPRPPLRNHPLPLGAREMRACAERKRDSATPKRREKLQKKMRVQVASTLAPSSYPLPAKEDQLPMLF